MKPKSILLMSILFFVSTAVVLAQEPKAIGVTPLMWLQEKSGSFLGYYTTGIYFEEGDYWDFGDEREFKVNVDVYDRIFNVGPGGFVERLCKLAFKDYDNFASGIICWPFHENLLPHVEGR